jgi:hypothetical protein
MAAPTGLCKINSALAHFQRNHTIKKLRDGANRIFLHSEFYYAPRNMQAIFGWISQVERTDGGVVIE